MTLLVLDFYGKLIFETENDFSILPSPNLPECWDRVPLLLERALSKLQNFS